MKPGRWKRRTRVERRNREWWRGMKCTVLGSGELLFNKPLRTHALTSLHFDLSGLVRVTVGARSIPLTRDSWKPRPC